MYKKERTMPFETRKEVLAYHNREKIPCLECGKLLTFLPRHIWIVHGMRANEYRAKWNIPKIVSLAGISYLEKRSMCMKERIDKGDIDPIEQVAMMRQQLAKLASDPKWRNRPVSVLSTEYARQEILANKIWHKSPVIKVVSAELKAEAVKRMRSRKETKETVQEIADDLNISCSRLYHWLKTSP